MKSIWSIALLCGCFGSGAMYDAHAQEPAAMEAVEAIDADFQRQIQDLERGRLQRLAELADGQPDAQANAIHETYFRRAIDAELYDEAEPLAERVIQSGKATPVVLWLAQLVNIFAEAERGAYQESLDNLLAIVKASARAQGDQPEADSPQPLPLEARLRLQEAYFQRLVHASQYEIARKAFAAIRDGAENPAAREYAESRLRQLDLVGQPAPPIAGDGVDGRPINLADFRGDVVLVVFWASWCLPNVEQADRLEAIRANHADQGFRLLGVNVDALGDDVGGVESVMPGVRRFLIEHNVTWPNILDTPGERTFADAYGVTELPNSILIGRDGSVRNLILSVETLDEIVSRAVQEPAP